MNPGCSFIYWDSLEKRFVRCSKKGRKFMAPSKDMFSVLDADEANRARCCGTSCVAHKERVVELCSDHESIVDIRGVVVYSDPTGIQDASPKYTQKLLNNIDL
jgi:hypothetical protein